MAMILVVGSILLFITQIIHVLKILDLVELMKLPLQTQRFSGNLFQPNQTAFVFVLGVISTMFIFKAEKDRFKFLIIFILSIGVALTASRAGFLMLLFFSLIFNILDLFHKSKNDLLFD